MILFRKFGKIGIERERKPFERLSFPFERPQKERTKLKLASLDFHVFGKNKIQDEGNYEHTGNHVGTEDVADVKCLGQYGG